MGYFDSFEDITETPTVDESMVYEPDWEWSPLERMKASGEESVGALFGAAGALFDTVGLEGAADWASNKAGEWWDDASSRDIVRTEFDSIDNPIDASKWAAETITSFIPDIGLMFLGGAGVGTAAGKAGATTLGKAAVKNTLRSGFKKNLDTIVKESSEFIPEKELYSLAAKRTAQDAGRLLGVAGSEGAMGAGQAYELERELLGEGASGARALGVGATQTAVSMLSPLNRLLAGRIPKGKGNILQMTIGEAGEEVSQEAIALAHEGGIDPNTTFKELISSEEGAMRLLESGVAGALLGGTFGGGASRLLKRKEEPTQEVTPLDEEIQEEITQTPEKVLEEAGIPLSPEETAKVRKEEVQQAFADKKMARTQAMLQRREEFLAAPPVEPAPVEEVYEPELPIQTRQAFRDAEIEARTQEILAERGTPVEPSVTPTGTTSYIGATPEDVGLPNAAKNMMMQNLVGEYIRGDLNKAPTKLAEKQAAKKEFVEAKKNPEAAAFRPQRRRVVAPQAPTTKKGWTSKGNVRSKVVNEEGHEAQLTKQGTEAWNLKLRRGEDGDYDMGTFKRLKDAEEALSRDQTAEEYYGPKEEKVEKPLTGAQRGRLESIDLGKVVGTAQSKTGTVGDPEAESAVMDSLLKSTKKFKEGRGASFQSYATTNAIGAIKDLQKKQAKSLEVQELSTEVEEGTEKEGTIASATKEDIDLTAATVIKEETIPVTVGEKTVNLRKEGKVYVDEEGNKYGTRKKDAIDKAKKKIAPPVKKISVEEYQKEQKKKKPTQLKKRNDQSKAEAKERQTVAKAKEESPDVVANNVITLPMSSKEFLRLSTSGERTIDRIKEEGFVEKGVDVYEEYDEGDPAAFKFDKKVADASPNPYLIVNKEGKVVGHDGRHRAVFGPDTMNVTMIYEGDIIGDPKPQFSKKPSGTISKETGSTVNKEFNKNFVKNVKDAEQLVRYAGFVKDKLDAPIDTTVRTMADYVNNQAKDKLKGVKVLDSSQFKKQHPQVWMNSYGSDAAMPSAFYYEGKIYIDGKGMSENFDDNQIARIFLHEAVHGVTLKEMQTKENSEYQARVMDLIETVRDKMLTADEYNLLALKYNWDANTAVRKRKEFHEDFTRFKRSTYYGLLNPDEFLAEAFSNREFQKELAKIKLEKPKGNIRTLWDKFVRLIADVLGLKKESEYTALDEILSTGTALMNYEPGTTKPPSKMVAPALVPPKEPEDWDKRARVMSKNSKGTNLRDYAGEVTNAVRGLGRNILKTSTEVLREIDPRLIKPLRKFESSIVERNVASRQKVKGFMDKYKALSMSDKNLLDLTLMNNTEEDIKKRNEILRRSGMTSDYKKVEELLKDIWKDKEKLGLNKYGEISGYFPRSVKDIPRLMQDMANDPEFNYIQNELKALGEDATQEDKEHAIKEMINTGRFPAISFMRTGADRKRKIERVSSKWKHHYRSAPDALLNHIYEQNEKISAHEMFVDSPARVKKVKQVTKIYEQLKGGKLKDDRRKELVGEAQALEQWLNDPERDTEGLDKFLAAEAPNLSFEDANAVLNVYRARLNQKGMHGVAGGFRNVALMSALGSPTSAITQIGDLAFSIYNNGPVNTVKAMLGPKVITAKDLDLENSMREFQTEGTAKWLDRVLTWSGLKYMDMFGKNTNINASLNRAKAQSFEEFSNEWGKVLGKDTEQTYKDIKGGKNTELSRYFVFNDLSNWQPISLSEMPQQYLTAGNGRIFYTLKSYNIKALNNVYRESVYKWRTAGSKKEKMEAAKNTGKLILLMTFAGATADELKDFLLGKGAGDTFSDNIHENLLKIGFMSRYTLDKGLSNQTMKSFLGDVLLPPTQWVVDPLADVYKTFKGEPDWKSLQSLPWGKLPYSWFSDGSEKREMDNLRKKIFARTLGGSSISSVRDEITQYNRWAKKNDKNPITIASIRRNIKKNRTS